MKIITENYVIRSFLNNDVDQFFDIAHEEKVKKYVPYAYCETKEDADDLVKYYSLGDCKRDFYLAICKDGKIIGAIIAVQIHTGYLDCSVLVSRECRNQGVMKEALLAFISWLKDNSRIILGLDLTIEKDNTSSQKLAQSIKAEKRLEEKQDHYRITIQ